MKIIKVPGEECCGVLEKWSVLPKVVGAMNMVLYSGFRPKVKEVLIEWSNCPVKNRAAYGARVFVESNGFQMEMVIVFSENQMNLSQVDIANLEKKKMVRFSFSECPLLITSQDFSNSFIFSLDCRIRAAIETYRQERIMDVCDVIESISVEIPYCDGSDDPEYDIGSL